MASSLASHFTYDDVLVTGGSGFIGSHTVGKLLDRGCLVWVLDDLSSGTIHNLLQCKDDSRLHIENGSVANYKKLESLARRVDAIIHLAGQVSVDLSLRKPELTNEINVGGTLNVLRAALKNQVQRVVYASSSSIYDNSASIPVIESAPLNPITPYGVSKLAAEKYSEVFHATFGLETVSLRYFNVYGPRQRGNAYGGVIAIFAERLSKNLPPMIYGEGEQTRDFIYVTDVAEANLQALRTSRGIGEAFNIGTGRPTTIKDLYHLMAKIAGKEGIKPIFSKPRTGDSHYSCANVSKANAVLGFKPMVSLRSGLQNLMKSIQK